MSVESRDQAPAYYRFRLGAYKATVISDGVLPLAAESTMFGGLPQDDIDRTLFENFQTPQALTAEVNTLVLEIGSQVVLFDTGTGGAGPFGARTGRLLANLKSAGFEPDEIDTVVITHIHPDHCWGLMKADGTPSFPNAKILVPESDFYYWTDETYSSLPLVGGTILPNRRILLPQQERIFFFKDGEEILPGVVAIGTPGHTVGHTIFMISSGQDQLCLIADLAHHHVLLLEYPKVEFAYDTDPKQGAETRIRMFDTLAANRMRLLCYHFPWPGIGYIVKHGEKYRYIAEPMVMTF